jgi:hypothetical protein
MTRNHLECPWTHSKGASILRIIAIVVFLQFIASVAQAQEIKILTGSQAEIKPTKVVFEGEDNDTVRIYTVGEISSSLGVTNIGLHSALSTGYSANMNLLVTTPASIQFDKGEINLNAGGSLLYGCPFTVKATGGIQYWKLRNRHSGWDALGIASVFSTLVGGSILLTAGLISHSPALDIGAGVVCLSSYPLASYCAKRSLASARLIKIDY